MSETIEIPFGEPLTLPASERGPRWITALDHDLHIGHVDPRHGQAGEPLFRGRPRLMRREVTLIEPNGHVSRVRLDYDKPGTESPAPKRASKKPAQKKKPAAKKRAA